MAKIYLVDTAKFNELYNNHFAGVVFHQDAKNGKTRIKGAQVGAIKYIKSFLGEKNVVLSNETE